MEGGVSRRRVAARLGALLTLLVGGALLVLGWKASSKAINPAPGTLPWSLGDYPRLRGESITVRSRTGVALAARYFRGGRRATVVLSHGYGGSRDELLPVADALHEAGFGVVTYDLRGSGRSGGGVTF